MKKPALVISAALLFGASTVALAQKADKAAKPATPATPAAKAPADTKAPAAAPADKAKPATPPAAAPAAPAMPEIKPPAELDQLKPFVGDWSCEGKDVVMGQELKSKATLKVAADLDKFWLSGRFEEKKSKAIPQPHKAVDFVTWDGTQFVRYGVDNMGSFMQSTSKGLEGDKITFTGTTKMMGKEAQVTESMTKGKKLLVQGSVTMGGQVAVTWDLTCTK